MARKALTEEDKLKVINENLADFSKGKSQETIDKFNAKDVDKRYTAIVGFLRKQNKPQKNEVTENILSLDVLGKVLKQTTETGELTALKLTLQNFIERIEKKIEDNKTKDEIKKLEVAIEAINAAGLDATEAEAKLAELKK